MSLGKHTSLSISLSVLILLITVLAYASLRIENSPDDTRQEQYAVLFDPYTSKDNALYKIFQAGGVPIRMGSFDFLVIVASSDSDFQKKMGQLGALLVFSPFIKGGCLIKNKTPLAVK